MTLAIRTITRLQDGDDAPALGAGQDGQALTWDNASGAFVATALVTDHGALTGLTDDDHVGYARLAGRAGGQTLYGGTAANDDITIHGTSSATRTTSYVLLQPTAGNVGIGTTAPTVNLHVAGADAATYAKFLLSSGGTEDFLEFYSGSSGEHLTGITFDSSSAFRFGTYSSIVPADYSEKARLTNTGSLGIGTTAPAEALDVTGNINATGVYKVDDVQVLSNRVIDARCADAANSGDATTDGLIDALRDAMVAHGLIAAA